MKASALFRIQRIIPAFMLPAALIVFVAVAHAQTVVPEMLGTWVPSASSSGLVRLTIAQRFTAPGQYSVHAWGSCSPKPCDLGVATMYPYSTSVANKAAKVGLAIYRTGFSEVTLVITNYGRNELSVQTLTRFTDRSGRSNYTMTIRMRNP